MGKTGLCGLLACGLVACGDTTSRDSGAGGSDSLSGSTNGALATTNTGTATGGVSGSASTSEGAATAGSQSSTGPSPVTFDVGNFNDFDGNGGLACDCGNTIGFSYIWIANSTQGTVSKLNTQTMVEEGRYLTRADGQGNPSRTSVSIDSRAVGVANRNGGVSKVWARPEFCDPLRNGTPGLQTSNDANFLPSGQDDCIAWETPFAYSTQRPVAWGPGTLNQQTCAWEDQVLWTGGCQPGVDTWAQVHRLDGDTGVVLDTIDVSGFECSSLSPYGAAIDPQGDYWMTNLVPGNDRLAHIDVNGILVDVITPPITPYGMTVDSQGRVWLSSWGGSGGASAARYDPIADSWALATNHVANVYSGIQEDALGRMWMNYWTYDGDGSNPGLVYINGETMDVSEPFGLGCAPGACRGLSVDLDGNVWSTSMVENRAFRFNPDTLALDTYDALVGPYTYSDMTGWALQNTACGAAAG